MEATENDGLGSSVGKSSFYFEKEKVNNRDENRTTGRTWTAENMNNGQIKMSK